MVRSLLAMLVAAGLVVAASTPHAATDALRVCADPDNLPFSAAAGSIRGLYVDVAELVAARLGVRAPGSAPFDLHQGTFDIDEAALHIGVRYTVALARAAMRSRA